MPIFLLDVSQLPAYRVLFATRSGFFSRLMHPARYLPRLPNLLRLRFARRREGSVLHDDRGGARPGGKALPPLLRRVSASQAILDRAYGKPPTFSTTDTTQLKRAIDMTDDDLAAIVAKARLTVVK